MHGGAFASPSGLFCQDSVMHQKQGWNREMGVGGQGGMSACSVKSFTWDLKVKTERILTHFNKNHPGVRGRGKASVKLHGQVLGAAHPPSELRHGPGDHDRVGMVETEASHYHHQPDPSTTSSRIHGSPSPKDFHTTKTGEPLEEGQSVPNYPAHLNGEAHEKFTFQNCFVSDKALKPGDGGSAKSMGVNGDCSFRGKLVRARWEQSPNFKSRGGLIRQDRGRLCSPAWPGHRAQDAVDIVGRE